MKPKTCQLISGQDPILHPVFANQVFSKIPADLTYAIAGKRQESACFSQR